ncbi:type II secretion system F family protein [Halieaceae bacterium IMCC8485]|jgi:type IV pilus assembly protein PilC|uniref:Type II secretion system F family protein n=1 Tax=Candidatus Seongchinamella marina TaxID=2518990 RepID=A0ABT3SQF8_9GAMM|nr:type II secretion system F family protein [Candidatus Seongchinamella marina]MBT3410608.1 type II secretion system F family protein [Halieaceae bacterium]MCX2972216.1 type II secretion system F family protein [Candidatus Seongchinamella marina]
MATATGSDVFTWSGTDKNGRSSKGEISAVSSAMAKAQLRRQGIKPKSVKKKPKPLFGSGQGKAIKAADIAIFTRQLATMMKAGVPLVQSFEIVADGVEKPRMKTLIVEIMNDVASGTGLAPSLAKHPRHFDELFCSLIASGEESGTLEVMLDRVATYKEKTEALKAKIRKAMTYPIAVVCVAVVVTLILLIKVIPVFAQTFQNFGSDLPAFTLFVMHLSEWVQEWWFIMLIAMTAIGFALREAKFRSVKFSEFLDKMWLKTPIVGGIVHDAVIARFSRTLATTFAAGVPLVDALESTAGAAGNSVYQKGIRQIKDDVTTGTTLYNSIKATGLFPNMLMQMVSIGEESGALDDMLGKVADHYEQAVDDAVDNLSALLEPLIMSILGVLVGGLLIAMYLPIFMLGSVI